ncbi:MAG TPA: class I SAM-dependent methyltransferase, partial [Rhizomicrobium sp.]|nr:class I SAM-dependent methyltransferase [Rhizomicrobium sp.]
MSDTKDLEEPTGAIPGARTFNRELAPVAIDHVCITSGFAPPPGSPLGEGMGAGFTYCELHCGSAVTATLLAASNPSGDFHVIDPRENLVEQGRALANDGNVRNITFHLAGIEDALEQTLPPFDYIVANGIYTWVPLHERALILSFARKFLKIGGAIYVSYNARPGWNKLDPFRRIFREATRGQNVDARQRLDAARETYKRLWDAKAPGIHGVGVLPAALDSLNDVPLDAIAADYANDFADPLYVTEVMSDFASVDCVLAGSAEFSETLGALMPHEPFLSAVSPMPTIAGRELAKDMLRDTSLRRDVFVRGGRRLAADNREMIMRGLAFALEQPAENVRYEMRMPFGDMRFDNPHARALTAMLEKRPQTLNELVEGAQKQGHEAEAVVANVHALLLTNQIRPVYRGTREASEGARKLREAIRARASGEQAIGFLPSAYGSAFAV